MENKGIQVIIGGFELSELKVLHTFECHFIPSMEGISEAFNHAEKEVSKLGSIMKTIEFEIEDRSLHEGIKKWFLVYERATAKRELIELIGRDVYNNRSLSSKIKLIKLTLLSKK